MDGARGARLDLAAEGLWEIPLNGIESFSVTVGKDQVRRLDPLWWSPYRTSVAVSWQREDGSLDAWIAGPIIGPPAETRATATFVRSQVRSGAWWIVAAGGAKGFPVRWRWKKSAAERMPMGIWRFYSGTR